MFDDFFTRALAAGIGVALIAGPLGCFIVWRRMAYFGATLSHSALLGIALAFLFDIHVIAGVFCIAAAIAPALYILEGRGTLPTDTLLGILAHGTLAAGLVLLAFLPSVRIDLMGYLFGDILAVSKSDIAIIYGGGISVVAVLYWIWRPLLASTVSAEIAAAEGLHAERVRFIFMLLVAAVIAVAMKIVGVLLIVSLLIIPPAAARRMSASPERMAIFASLVGVIAVVFGLFGSLQFDTPSGPSIVVAAVVIFLMSLLPFEMPRKPNS
ncbi:MAG: iron chelate uptake ABC transporter family permease subunit [Methyloligellaceae bacterium]